MFQLKQFYMQEEGGDGGNGDGGQGPEISPEVQKMIEARAEALANERTSGLKSKNTQVILENKELKAALKPFEGFDAEALRSMMGRIDNDEEARLLASGKFEEAMSKRTERMKHSYEQETAKERAAREAAESRAEKFQRRVLENGIRAEAAAAGIHQHAIDDALYRAGGTFQLDDEGNPVAVEGAYGKDGKPLTLKEWFADMKEKAPHWWPATGNGGGAGHGGGKGGGSKGDFGGKPSDRAAAIAQKFPELARNG